MSKTIRLRKGLDIRMEGKAEPLLENSSYSEFYAIKPSEFPGLTPRLSVVQGQVVKAGDQLFHDKSYPEISFVSPVSGVVEVINRGERRKIREVVVRADGKLESVDFGKADPLSMEASAVRELLLKSGLWPFIKRRPYGVLARPHETPKSIFVSAFDTSPLAPDFAFILKGEEKVFQTGLLALSRLTKGKVHLGLPAGQEHPGINMKHVDITFYQGPHPTGNVGIHIHHSDPVNKGDVVWTVPPQAVLYIGRLFENGRVDFSKIIALAGSEVKSPKYYRTIGGAQAGSLVRDKLKSGSGYRIISGNVLSGKRIAKDGYIGLLDSLVTVIPEGDYYEFLGWAMPRFDKHSMSHAYFSWLMPGRSYRPDTNLHGEKRAYVVTGQYEKVVPMDILPVQLVKSILADDIEKMENLGIYEVIEEDLALCEYVCTSKMEVQDILRKGIRLMMKELG
jgi:Na+-transporting NADH:ubiquinone oxidoreductase subunit A